MLFATTITILSFIYIMRKFCNIKASTKMQLSNMTSI